MCGTSAGSSALIYQMVMTDGKLLMEHHRRLVEVTRTKNTGDLRGGARVNLFCLDGVSHKTEFKVKVRKIPFR